MLKFGFTFRFFVGVLRDGGQCCLRNESAESVGRVFLGRDVDFSGSVEVVGLRTTASVWNVPKEYGPYSELFFFLFNEQPTTCEKVVGLRRWGWQVVYQ